MKDSDPSIRVHIADSITGGFSGYLKMNSVVERLKVLMRDSDPRVREAVAVSISRMTGKRRTARRVLNTLSEDKESRVVDQTFRSALSLEGRRGMNFIYRKLQRRKKSNKIVETNNNQLNAKDMIREALESGGAKAERVLDHFMKDPDSNIRVYVADSIIGSSGDLKVKSAVERLKVLMRDSDSEVRAVVAESAGRIKSEKEAVIEILNTLKNDSSLRVKKGVITGAVALGGSSAEEILDHFMTGSDLEGKRDIRTGVIKLEGYGRAKGLLDHVTKNSDMKVKEDAIAGTVELRELKVEKIQDSDPSIRVHIASSIIGQSGDLKIKSAIERLKFLMRDSDSEVRTAVAESAGRMKSEKESAVEILNTLKNDPILGVKKYVITGAVRLGGSSAEEILDYFMEDSDPSIRVHIADSIIGWSGYLRIKTAMEKLKVLMRDSDSEVRTAVAESVGRMKSYNKKEELVEILMVLGNDKEFSIVVEVVKSALSLGRETALTVLTSILLKNKNPQVQEYIGPIVREHLGRRAYRKLLSNSSCAVSLSAN